MQMYENRPDANQSNSRKRPTTMFHEETSLDPSDWKAFHDLCSAELDSLIEHVATTSQRPVWQPIPTFVKEKLAEPLPIEPQGAQQVCDEIRSSILPYHFGKHASTVFRLGAW